MANSGRPSRFLPTIVLLLLAVSTVYGVPDLAPNHPMRRASRKLQEPEGSQALKQQLLENYDRTTFPFESVWGDSAVRQGVVVELGINFHRVFDVDVTTSVADLIVWVRQRWTDPRLAWDTSVYNVSTLHFWIGDGSGAGGETSEIWTPDLHLWNLETPISSTLADTSALVSPDGTVFWSRPGHIKPVCKFQGLQDFPFDMLDCTMEIGSWSYSGLYIRPVKMDEGFSIGGSETAGESFAEFSLSAVTAEEFLYPPYPSAPEEDWPVIFYHISFQRAWQPYARGYLVLQIVLNLAAFCCLWLPPHIGERMSLSITSVLAAVASELVVAAKLPAAGELTWFAKFSLMSLVFTALVLFQSAIVIYFYYHTGDNLKPRWYQWIERKVKEYWGEEKDVSPGKNEHRGKEEPVVDEMMMKRKSVVRFKDDSDEMDTDESTLPQNGQKLASRGSSEDHHEVSVDADDSEFDTAHEDDPGPGTLHKDFSSFRTRKSIKTILGRDADDFKNAKEMENNIRWQLVATRIDEYSRVLFPVAFSIYLAATFSNLNL